MYNVNKLGKRVMAIVLSLTVILLIGVGAVSAQVFEEYDDYDVEKWECFCYEMYAEDYYEYEYVLGHSDFVTEVYESNLVMPFSSNDWPVSNATDLDNALTNAASGDTITLTADITRRTRIEIGLPARTLTLVTNGYTLNVISSQGAGLRVTSGSALLMNDTGGGFFNVTGQGDAVYARASIIQVSNATSTGGLCAVHAISGSTVTVRGNAVNQSTQSGSRGVFSDGGSTVTVEGNVTGGSPSVRASGSTITVDGDVSTNGSRGVDAIHNGNITIGRDVFVTNAGWSTGVQASHGARITIYRNIAVTSASPASRGANANNGGVITVEGTIVAPTYIWIGDGARTRAQNDTPTTKEGYLTYTDGTSTVWVKNGSPAVTAVTATHPIMPHIAGNNVITVDGRNLDLAEIRVGAFLNDTGEALYVVTPIGTDTRVTATLNFPTNMTGNGRNYTVRVSLDGGETWIDVEYTASVSVGIISFVPNPIHYAYLIGYRDGTVRPRGNITRAEVSTIFFRLISDEDRAEFWSQTNTFRDVTLERWYNNPISTMANAGFIQGYRDGTFRPGAAITRAEFATIVSRFMGMEYTGADRFTDIDGHWASSAINSIAYAGWIRGYGDGTFRPNNTITRAEVAAVVNRVFLRTPETVGDLLPGMIRWSDNANPNAWYYLHIQEATNSHHHEMKECGIYERWTELISPRDWTVLQRPDSTPECILN